MKHQEITENNSVAQATDVVAAEMDGEILMMRIESGMYYGLDNIGSRIWELMAEPRQVSFLINCLVEEYEVEKEQCQSDTLELLNSLYAEGLIRVE